ncbi:hypothetical protein RJ639_008021 [Escallonia herrerae]|uniref:Reverse transcriptase Ty1/copia-type domain-containing protein n=1 Tax=Escallonia herrerae TaxID=1293975 RepID=A0AA89AQ98_9ASTE|nr:hypothetical protein RJ639_008021 [Escallonia herrerae]
MVAGAKEEIRRGLRFVTCDTDLGFSDPVELSSFVDAFSSRFAMKDLGDLHFFLGIEARRDSSGLFLSQTRNTATLLQRFDMLGANSVSTPMPSTPQPSLHHGDLLPDLTVYHSMVGALQYLTMTRPDFVYSVSIASQFMHSPRTSHLHVVKRIFRYLKGIMRHGLLLRLISDLSLIAYVDADWAECPDSRRSTSSYALFLGSNVVSWSAKKQPIVSRSSAEFEYRSVAYAVAELYWLHQLLRDLGVFLHRPVIVYCDNVSATYLAANPVFHARTKHIEIDFHFVREKVASVISNSSGLIPSGRFQSNLFSNKARESSIDAAANAMPGHILLPAPKGINSKLFP